MYKGKRGNSRENCPCDATMENCLKKTGNFVTIKKSKERKMLGCLIKKDMKQCGIPAAEKAG